MLKKGKIKIAVLFIALSVMSSSVVAFAQSYRNKYVYGAMYTVVVDGTTDNDANFVTVSLTEIKKADGSTSNYKQVRGDVLDSAGNQISEKTNISIPKQETTTIILDKPYVRGTEMKLRMKGNDSSLDCIVTFAASISETN